MFNTVLFPINQSREAREAVEVVVDVVKKYRSHLILLSVVEKPAEVVQSANPSEDVVMSLLESAKQMFSQQGIEAEILEKEGKPAFVICDVADEVNANLIIMGSRGLGLTNEGAADSVTNRVINLSPCPVMIVP
jgi:nucleotide-binding universal stress UspA family protein